MNHARPAGAAAGAGGGSLYCKQNQLRQCNFIFKGKQIHWSNESMSTVTSERQMSIMCDDKFERLYRLVANEKNGLVPIGKFLQV